MDLINNRKADFTRFLAANGGFSEPFVVVDVGVQGGENPRWDLLGEHVVIHGLDPIPEVIDELRARHSDGCKTHHYHCLAAGNEDGERSFYFNSADPCSSSLYEQGADRFDINRGRVDTCRQTAVRRLDTLVNDGLISPADFLKVDVEGFEKDVLLGASDLLKSVIGLEVETNFNFSPEYPDSHFVAIGNILSRYGFRVFDLNFNRVPRAAFRATIGDTPVLREVGKPATVIVLFCRDYIEEVEQPQNYVCPPTPATADQILKALTIYELHGLNDIALDTCVRFRDRLESRIDVDHAVRLLADRYCRQPRQGLQDVQRQLQDVQRQLHYALNSKSWKLTAPLRAIRSLF